MDPTDPRLERLRRLRAGRADPRLDRLRELKAAPGRKAVAKELFAGPEGMAPAPAPTGPIEMRQPTAAEVIGLNDPVGKAKQFAANVPELATMAARDVAGAATGFATQPHEGLGGEIPEKPANPLAGLQAGQKVREKFNPALETIDEAAGGAPTDMLGTLARYVGPLPVVAAGRATAKAVGKNLAARATGRDVSRVAQALRSADDATASTSLAAQRGRMTEAAAVDAQLNPPKAPPAPTVAEAEIVAPTPTPAPTGRVGLSPRDVDYRHRHSPFNNLPAKVRTQLSKERISDPVAQDFNAAERWLDHSARDHDLPIEEAAEKLRSQGYSVRPEAVEWAKGQAAKEVAAFTMNKVDPTIPPRRQKGTARALVGPPPAAKIGNPKYASMSDDEVFQRRKEIIDRMDVAQQDVGKGVRQWTREDLNSPVHASQRSGTKITNAGGRAIGRAKQDGGILDELDAELRARGHSDEAISDRYFKAEETVAAPEEDFLDAMPVRQSNIGAQMPKPPVPPGDVNRPAVTGVAHAKSGQPFRSTLLRGEGRKDSPYGEGIDSPILGEARYTTPSREYAEHFGPNVTEHPVEINKPLVIETDQQWSELAQQAGWPYANPISLDPAKRAKELPGLAARMRKVLEGRGYDGVVIRMDQRGDMAKTLRTLFGEDQAIEFPKKPPTKEPPIEMGDAYEGPRDQTVEGKFSHWGLWKSLSPEERQARYGVDDITARQKNWNLLPVAARREARRHYEGRDPGELGAAGAAIVPAAGAIGGAAYGVASAGPEDSKLSRAATFGAAGLAAGVGAVTGARALARSTAKPLPPNLQPVYERARERIDFGGKKQLAADEAAEGKFMARVQRFAENVGNDLAPIERLGRKAEKAGLRPTENPRYQLSYVKSGDRTIEQFMREGVVDPVTRKQIGPAYADIVKPFDGDIERIRQGFTYAVQERAVGRGLAAFGGDQQALSDAAALVGHWRADPAMQQFKKTLEAFTDGIGNYAVKSGLWTEAQWAGMKASDALYIPFKRVMEEQLKRGARGPIGAGTGLANVTSGLKDFVGSKRAVADPARALAEYAAAVIRRADRYRVGHHIFDAADALGPDGDLILSRITPSGAPSTVATRTGAIRRAVQNAQAQGLNINQQTVEALDDLFTPVFDPKNPVIWRNGPKGREYGVVNAPDLWRAVSSLHQLNDTAVRRFLDMTIRPLRRVFVATTTGLTPRFAGGTNPARDITDALAKSQAGLRMDDIAVGYASAIGGKAGVSKLFADAERFGLGSVSNFSQPTSAKAYQQMLAPTSRADKIKSAVRTTATAPIRPFEMFGEASDLGPRLGEVRAAKRKMQHLVDNGMWTPDDLDLYASTLGREVTLDFANKPGNPVLRLFADYVPFFGPSLNSPVSMAGALRRNPKRVVATASAVAAAGVVRWTMKHRSPEVLTKENDRTPGERASFLFFPMDDNGDLTIRVPIGQELGLVAAGVEAGLDAWLDDDPHAAELFRQALLRSLPPTELPVASAMIENARNKRNFGGAPVEPRRLEGLPAAERRLPTTSPLFDVLSDAARKTGKLTGSESLQNTSPLQAENVFRSVFSAATPAFEAGLEPLSKAISGREAERRLPTSTRQNPLNPVGSLIANPNPRTTASEQDYYAMKERITQARESARQTGKAGTDEAYERVIGTYGRDLDPGDVRVVKRADEILGKIRMAEVSIQAAYRNRQIDGQEAKRQLDELQKERHEVYRYAVEVLREQEAATP